MSPRNSDSQPTWQGIVAGAVGGLVAAWAMEQLQQRLSRLLDDGADEAQRRTERSQAWDARTQDQLSGEHRSATERAAEAGAHAFAARVDASTRAALAQGLHYAFGIGAGATYGALAEVDPRVTRYAGIAFGLGVWASADEISTALFGLAPPPAERPLLAHTYSFLSHVAYGVTTEAVRKGIRAALA
jgi:uncharacterized membrane protein YagU involved in acid resistance